MFVLAIHYSVFNMLEWRRIKRPSSPGKCFDKGHQPIQRNILQKININRSERAWKHVFR